MFVAVECILAKKDLEQRGPKCYNYFGPPRKRKPLDIVLDLYCGHELWAKSLYWPSPPQKVTLQLV